MRIAIVNQHYKPDLSPVANLVASLAEHLARQGHEVTVLTSRGIYATDGRAAPPDPVDNLHIWRAPSPRFTQNTLPRRAFLYAWYGIMLSMRMLTLSRQDVILTTTTPPYVGLFGVLHKWLHWRTKLVVWNMDTYPDIVEAAALIRRGGLIARLARAAQRWLFRRLDHVICLDEAMRDLVASQYSPKGRRLPITVLPNFEPLAMFDADASHPRWSGVSRLGLEGRFLVLYLGNAGYGHRFTAVVEAAEALRDQPVSFVFVGGGFARQWIAEQIQQRGLTNIVLEGYVPNDQRLAALATADLGLISLDDAALGMMSPSKLHAKLAMGLPVLYVGPRGSNVDHAISTYRCGISFRHDQGVELAQRIRQLMHDPEAMAAMRRRARQAFEEAYCDRAVLPRFEALLQAVHERQG